MRPYDVVIRPTAVAALCLLLLSFGTTRSLAAQEKDKKGADEATYAHAVDLYRKGYPLDAVAVLSSLDSGGLRDGVEAFASRVIAPPRPVLIGAAMMHVDLALSQRNLGRGAAFHTHTPIASQLFAMADKLYPEPSADAVALRGARAIARALLDDRWGRRARVYIEQTLKVFTDDGMLLLMLGTAYENDGTGSANVYNAQALASARMDQSADLEAAAGALDRALALMPHSSEVRLRRARLDILQGHDAAAERRLATLIGTDSSDQWRFLALVLLGDLRARAGALDEAATRYREALQLHPSAQSAAVALSEVLHRSGDTTGAAAVTEQLLGRDRAADPDDPWQVYRYGHGKIAEQELAVLRAEGRQ